MGRRQKRGTDCTQPGRSHNLDISVGKCGIAVFPPSACRPLDLRLLAGRNMQGRCACVEPGQTAVALSLRDSTSGEDGSDSLCRAPLVDCWLHTTCWLTTWLLCWSSSQRMLRPCSALRPSRQTGSEASGLFHRRDDANLINRGVVRQATVCLLWLSLPVTTNKVAALAVPLCEGRQGCAVGAAAEEDRECVVLLIMISDFARIMISLAAVFRQAMSDQFRVNTFMRSATICRSGLRAVCADHIPFCNPSEAAMHTVRTSRERKGAEGAQLLWQEEAEVHRNETVKPLELERRPSVP